MECQSVQPDLGISKSLANIVPTKSFIASSIAIILEPLMDESPFVVGKEACRRGIIVHKEICSNGDNDGQQSLQDKNPAPAFVVSYPGHMSYSPGEDATKRPGQGGRTEEESDTVMLLIAFVPHGQIEDDPGE